MTGKIEFPWFLSKELQSRLAPLEGGNEEHNLDQTLSKMCLINQEIRCHFLLDGIKKMRSVSKEYTKVWSTRQGTHTRTRPGGRCGKYPSLKLHHCQELSDFLALLLVGTSSDLPTA